jgi:6-phosphogluconolactonase
MNVEMLSDPESVAREGARIIAAEARASVAARGSFTVAMSGGNTPWLMLRALADQDVPWKEVHLLQVDERVVQEESDERNLKHIRDSLLDHVPLRLDQVYAMPVESHNLEAGADNYALRLQQIAGSPAVLDLIHLGLGPDGHTASLVPGDPVLEITDRDVAVTGVYQGRRRMTLTFPILNRSRKILWVVTGTEKVGMLVRLRNGDSSIPAGRVHQDHALVLADRAAAGEMR